MNEPSERQKLKDDLTEALDEIYLLRAVSADEARRIRWEEIPRAKSHKRRQELLDRVERLEEAACGNVAAAWNQSVSPARVLKIAGASEVLTYEIWKGGT